jgi:hypothetical protein
MVQDYILLSSVASSAAIVNLELFCIQCLGFCEADVFHYVHFAITKQMT